MPTKKQHLIQAEHNERFARSLDKDASYQPFKDWVVSGYFYSALHYVEAYLACQSPPLHSPDHRARDDKVLLDPTLSQIYAEYSDLKNDSTNARYQMYQFSPGEIANSVKPTHEAIKTFIQRKIP